MTPAEIRAFIPPQGCDLSEMPLFEMLREIAAQLAEHNATMHLSFEEGRESRRRTEEHQEKIIQLQGGLTEKFEKNFSPPPMQIVERGDSPTHLGCLVRLPDGSHAIAVPTENPFEPSMVNLDPSDTARILALIGKTPEGKPQ